MTATTGFESFLPSQTERLNSQRKGRRMTALAEVLSDEQAFRTVFGTGRLNSSAPVSPLVRRNFERVKELLGEDARWWLANMPPSPIIAGAAEGAGASSRITFVCGYESFLEVERGGRRRRELGDQLPSFAIALDYPVPAVTGIQWEHPDGRFTASFSETGPELASGLSVTDITRYQGELLTARLYG